MTRILYVEDEEFLAKVVRETFEHAGYKVRHLREGDQLMKELESFEPDICILDVMLPRVDGFQLAGMIRSAKPELPILFLSAKAFTEDVIKGFQSGGNDYVRKPFSMEELMIRVENLLKITRNKASASIKKIWDIASFRIDSDSLELSGPNGTVKLSYREMQVVELLAQHQNKTIDRKLILLSVWEDDSFFNSRNLDVYIRKIRKHFAADEGIELITLKGKGYHFKVSDK
ncbi:MAG: response regulator transcription factor [Bacteroidetes bacterium]|nr:MAG: response regulator transcription factor [Bacteroidota bacterium]